MSRKKIHRRPTNNTKKPESVGRQYPESNPSSATNENCKNSELTEGMMTTGEHLEGLRKILIGILTIVFLFSCIAFVCKDRLFDIIFAPSSSEFILYRLINCIVDSIGVSWMHLDTFNVQLISTELSAQFMTHIEMSLYFGLLASSPYIVYRIFGYIRPALYENERRYSTYLVMAVYVLFAIGVLMNYYIIFPISFRFLGTYQVNKAVISTIAIFVLRVIVRITVFYDGCRIRDSDFGIYSRQTRLDRCINAVQISQTGIRYNNDCFCIHYSA